MWKQLVRRAAKDNNRPYSERGVPWTKGGGHPRAQCVHSGAATKSPYMGRWTDTCDSSRLGRKAGWAQSGIKKSVNNFARRKIVGRSER